MEQITNYSCTQEIFDKVKIANMPNLCYGIGKTEAVCSFLFDKDPGFDSAFFPSEWVPSPENLYVTPMYYQKVMKYMSKSSSTFSFTSTSRLFAMVESMMHRISFKHYGCNYCKAKFSKENGCEHILETHPDIVRKALEISMDVASSDDDGLNNMLYKLQFDANSLQPKNGFPPVRSHGWNTIAPTIDQDYYDFLPEEEEEDSKDYLYGHFNERILDDSKDFPISNKINSYFKKLGDHYILNSKIDEQANLNQDRDVLRAETLFTPAIESILLPYTTKPSKPPEPSPPPAPPKQSLAELSPEEIRDFTAESPRSKKQKAPKQPKYEPFIKHIPADLIPEIVKSIASQFITSYAEANLQSAVKPILTAKKKELKIKAREEREARKKREEKERLDAFREKRSKLIDRVAPSATTSIIRSFLRSAVERVFREEKRRSLLKAEEVIVSEPGGDGVPAIVLKGLKSYSHHNTATIKALFGGYQFQADEDGEPKIRYRFNGAHFEALVYLAKIQDIKAVLNRGSFFIDNCTLQATALSGGDAESAALRTYTGQDVMIVSTTRCFNPANALPDMLSLSGGQSSPECIVAGA